jgi:hypothetical protein
MKFENTQSLLSIIAERQAGISDNTPSWSNGTSPVTLSIGYVSKAGMCMSDGIVITEAPPAITETVMKWVETHNSHDSSDKVYVEPGCGGLIIR